MLPIKHEVDLTWNPEPEAFSFQVMRHLAGKTNWTLEGTTTLPAFKDTKVVAGQTYVYEVYAFGPTGVKSAPSATFNITVPN